MKGEQEEAAAAAAAESLPPRAARRPGAELTKHRSTVCVEEQNRTEALHQESQFKSQETTDCSSVC